MPLYHDPPSNIEGVTLALSAVLLVGSGFFWVSHNALLKRRLWPSWLVVTSIAFTAFAWYLGGLLPAGFMLASGTFFARLNRDRTRFCDGCGRTVFSPMFSPQAEFCPSCARPLH